MNRYRAQITAFVAILTLVFIGPATWSGADELKAHLAALRDQVNNPALDITRREQLALEMAATLDRAAQAATLADERRARLSEAVESLDTFVHKNPDSPQQRHFRLQAAIYLWAQARSWSEQWDRAPTDLAAREQAIKALDAVIGRLRTLETERPGAADVSSQNVRFRLARALADRAGFDREASPDRRRREEEALTFLERPTTTERGLQGFAHLLRSELLGRLGNADAAKAAWDAASKSTPPPPAESLLEARISVLLVRKHFEEALGAVAASKVEPIAKNPLALRVRLAQLASLSGKARSAAESEAFRLARSLRELDEAEGQRAVLGLARALTEPDAAQEPDAWHALAEGYSRLGDPDHASALEVRGADRAEALGRHEQAATSRLRAGALFYQAGKYREADPLLSRVVMDPKAGPSRPLAGSLRALARGRALAMKAPGATLKDYLAALEYQIHEFPDDPAAGEARWLLGKARLASGDREAARRLWAAISQGHPRWLESRVATAHQTQEELDNQRLSGDQAESLKRFAEARRFLRTSFEASRKASEKDEINLQLARLELTAGVGHPEEALRLAEAVQATTVGSEVRGKAARLRLVALAELNRYVEAEKVARGEVHKASASECIETARILDHTLSDADSDLRMRRTGLIIRVLVARSLERPDGLTPAQLAEARIRLSRALLLSGDDLGARKALGDGSFAGSAANDDLLRDLADVYTRLDAYELAVDVHRLRTRQAAPGSLAWLDARYGLSLALYRSGKADDARQIIDATDILHPELGGSNLSEKFKRLRQRLQVE